MTQNNLQAQLKECDVLRAVLGKERVNSIVEKCLNLVMMNPDAILLFISGEPPPEYLLRLMSSSLGLKRNLEGRIANSLF